MEKSSSTDKALIKVEECEKNLRLTRDFDLYLDMLYTLKNEYLIIFCLKNTSDQIISEKTAEKIHRLGFVNFTAKAGMKYAGISNNGRIVYDNASVVDKPPVSVDVNISGKNFCVSFEEKEVGIKINGVDQSLNCQGINIAVYDCQESRLEDVSCYDSSENNTDFLQKNPEFYHRNMYYDKQYIDSHIHVPEKYKDGLTLPMRKSYFSDRRLNVREVEKGIFLPRRFSHGRVSGGVCDENFNFITGHQILNVRIRDNHGDDRHIWGSYEVPAEDIVYIDETVLYGGSLIEHPGHLITESFADRLWWLVQNADSNIKIAVEILWGKATFIAEYNSFVMEFFDALGISRDRIIIIEKPTQFKKIIVPDQSSIPLNYCFPYEFTSEYIKPFQYITNRLTPGKYKKIYLTKSNTQQKNIIGEDYFIDFFEKKGYKIIHPEDHTIKEKAELMYGADEVATVDGTNSLFTVFCKPTVKLTILTRRLNFWDTPQQLITEAVGIKEFYLVNTSGGFLSEFSDDAFSNYSSGMTFLCVTEEFKNYVKRVYGEELDITPEESLKNCLYEYLSFFVKFYSDPVRFGVVKDIKMIDVLRGMSEIILGKDLDESHLDHTADEKRVRTLKKQLNEENGLNAEKIRLLTDKAKECIEENARLKQAFTQLEAENQRLREQNAELSSYMAEISGLLDALGSQSAPEE